MNTISTEQAKQLAAQAALQEVNQGMNLGLGTGSTVAKFLPALAAKISDGLKVRCCATSRQTDAIATELGIRIEPPQNFKHLDLVVDGADSIDPEINLIKGGGGALVRERIIAQMAKRVVIIADDTKLVKQLGENHPLPIAVIPFGAERTASRIAQTMLSFTGTKPSAQRRMGHDGKPFVSDDGLAVFDLAMGSIDDLDELDAALRQCAGLVDVGMFIGVAETAYIAISNGISDDNERVIQINRQ